MPTNRMGEGSGFRIRRPPNITRNGSFSDVDPTVAAELAELNDLLAKRIFGPFPAAGGRVGAAMVAGAVLDPAVVLKAELMPKRSDQTWAAGSLATALKTAKDSKDPRDNRITLGEYIDQKQALAALKYNFDNFAQDDWATLDFNTRTILGDAYPAIRSYLVAYAYLEKGVREFHALKSFILTAPGGVANIASYATVSAARAIVKKKGIQIAGFEFNNSNELVISLRKSAPNFSSVSFAPSTLAKVESYVSSSVQENLIKNAKLGELVPDALMGRVVELIKRSTVKIDLTNIDEALPILLSQAGGGSGLLDSTSFAAEASEEDFTVDFFEDDDSAIQVSRSAVKCAAQLFYVMVAGDELNVFDIVNFLTHKHLVRGRAEIADNQLREDLQGYVFSDKFPDLKHPRILDRTRPAERQMFYRQVFGYGDAEVTEDVIVNADFPNLWKVLILESAEYLERAQASPHPDNFVSRQKVMQAVEDLQYNLSTHCTGMANVIAPLINAELNFVVNRIFKHDEVKRQVIPFGGSWWRVVEELHAEMKHARPKTTALYNKARLGHDIIASIAEYNPATFEDDARFSDFISDVDAFITTQSILQEALTDDLKRDQERQPANGSTATASPAPVAAPSGANGKPSTDEWDF